MVTWSNSPLTQAEAHMVVAQWYDIVDGLAPPTVAWEWTESPLASKTKHRLKEAGLIKRVDERIDGSPWRTTDRLWTDVINRVSEDETIGARATGQELLCEPMRSDGESRKLVDPSPSPGIFEQETLNGERIEIVEDDDLRAWWEADKAKAENKNPEDGDSRDYTQLSLTLFETGQTRLDEWVSAVGSTDPLSVRRRAH